MRIKPRIYLAGPDVFLPDPIRRGAALKAICDGHGIAGVYPLDPAPLTVSADLPQWRQIALANEAHIRTADGLIANLTPFRGPCADPGTVYELGFARALGLPVFGWSASGATVLERVGAAIDHEGLTVEDFGLAENLMIPGAIAESGGQLFAETLQQPWADLSLFVRCVVAVTEYFHECG